MRHPCRFVAVACVLLGLPAPALAQQRATITGRVQSEGGVPLASAQVYIEGLNIGGLTKEDGSYSLDVANASGQEVTLTARLLGYKQLSTRLALTPGTIRHDFTLVVNPVQLQTMVVTAMGQTKQKSQLGTAQQQISTAQLNTTHDPNIVNMLSGKVSGVQISGSGTQGGSSHIVIRGTKSLLGDNSPLYVVDGVPILTSGHAARGGSPGGGYDYGSTVSDINPNDIATMSILKGPNAAALYGSRASNGVIVITTKSGRNSGGKISSHLTTSYTFDNVGILPNTRTSTGRGREATSVMWTARAAVSTMATTRASARSWMAG